VNQSGFSASVFKRFGKLLPKAVESSLPERTAVVDPLFGNGEALGLNAAGADSPNFFGVDEPAFFENLQMLNDGGQRDVERFRQTRNGYRAFAQLLDDRAARGIAKGVKNAVDGGSLTKHVSCFSSLRMN
jgi:hypothetical protein